MTKMIEKQVIIEKEKWSVIIRLEQMQKSPTDAIKFVDSYFSYFL